MFAVVRDAILRLPEPAYQFQAFFEDSLIVVEGDMERQIFALVVTAAASEVDAAAGQKIERGPLLGDANG